MTAWGGGFLTGLVAAQSIQIQANMIARADAIMRSIQMNANSGKEKLSPEVVSAIRDKLKDAANLGKLGMLAAQSKVPEWMLADWVNNPLNIPGYETLLDIARVVCDETIVLAADSALRSDKYQEQAFEFAVYPEKGECSHMALAYCALGLNGEAGEVAEKIKKHIRDKTPLPRAEITKELGDVLWYIAALASELNVPLVEIAEQNLSKLHSRKQRNKLHGSGDER